MSGSKVKLQIRRSAPVSRPHHDGSCGRRTRLRREASVPALDGMDAPGPLLYGTSGHRHTNGSLPPTALSAAILLLLGSRFVAGRGLPQTSYVCGSALGKPCGITPGDLAPLPSDLPPLPSDMAPVPLEMCSGQTPALWMQVGESRLLMDVDTGSSEAVVAAEAFEASDQAIYTELPGTIAYGTGEANGTYVLDMVSPGPGLQVQAALLVGEMDGSRAGMPRECPTNVDAPGYDGLLGLGPATTSAANVPMLRQALNQPGGLHGAFSLALCPDSGFIYWGGFQAAHVRGPLAYVTLLESDTEHYQTLATNVRLGSDSLLRAGGSISAVWDSGTNEVLLPRTLLQNFMRIANETGRLKLTSGGDIFDCGETEQDPLPTLSVSLQNNQDGQLFDLSIPPANYLYTAGNATATGCSQLLIGLNQDAGLLSESVLLGLPALYGSMVVHDPEHRRLGVGPLDSSLC